MKTAIAFFVLAALMFVASPHVGSWEQPLVVGGWVSLTFGLVLVVMLLRGGR